MLVPIILGSVSDKPYADSIIEELEVYEIPYKLIVASAHKVPERVFEIVTDYNKSDDAICYITIAGRSNGLSGVVAANSIHPVIACPPFKDKSDYLVNIHSTVQMPNDTPVLTILEPKNTAQAIARIFGLLDKKLKDSVVKQIAAIKASYK